MVRNMDNPTTISITKKTRDNLRALGVKGENYDIIIQRLIQEHEQHKK